MCCSVLDPSSRTIVTTRSSHRGPLNLYGKRRISISALPSRHLGMEFTVKPRSRPPKQSWQSVRIVPAAKATSVSRRQQIVLRARPSFRLLIIEVPPHSASAWRRPVCCKKHLQKVKTSTREKQSSRPYWNRNLGQSKRRHQQSRAANIVNTWESMSRRRHRKRRASAPPSKR